MKRNYFIVALQYIGLLLLIAGIFLGVNFLTKGLFYVSLPIALVLGAIAQIIVINLVKQKRKVENRYAANKMKTILGIVYFLIVMLSIPFFLHFLTISIKEKVDVQSYYEKDIANFKQTMDKFKKETKLFRDAIVVKLENSGMSDGNIKAEVDRELSPLINAYSEIGIKSNDYTHGFREVLSQWNLFLISSYVEMWDKEKAIWTNKLVETYNDINNKNGNIRKNFQAVPFQSEDLSTIFTKIDFKNGAWVITIIALFIVHFLMLIEYITIRKKEKGRIIKSKLDSGTSAY